MTRVAVLMGGLSAEREVSLSSGKACAGALRRAGFDVTEIDVTSDIQALAAALSPKQMLRLTRCMAGSVRMAAFKACLS